MTVAVIHQGRIDGPDIDGPFNDSTGMFIACIALCEYLLGVVVFIAVEKQAVTDEVRITSPH